MKNKDDSPAQDNYVDLDEAEYIMEKIHGVNHSLVEKYCNLVLGEYSLFKLVKYEIIILLFGSIPGALGLALRKLIFPSLFKNIGKGTIFGRNITIRCANNMVIGDNVVFDDNCLIDARGAEDEKLIIGNNVIINRNATVQSKVGALHIGDNTIVGADTCIASQGGIYIGENVAIAAACKIVGALFSLRDTGDRSKSPYRRYSKGPIRIQEYCLLAGGVVVLDGVTIGKFCNIGPGCIIMKDLADFSIASPRPPVVFKIPNTTDKQPD